MRPRSRTKRSGFSLLAVLFGVAAITIILGVALPSMTNAIANVKLRASMTSVSGLLQNRSEEHTSELQSRSDLVCRLLLEKKKTIILLRSQNLVIDHPLEYFGHWRRLLGFCNAMLDWCGQVRSASSAAPTSSASLWPVVQL